MITLLFPVLDDGHQRYSLGAFTLKDEHHGVLSESSLDCRVMFASEQSEAFEARYMRSKLYDVNPLGYKIWIDRVNAFRVIASVDTFEFSLQESEIISQGNAYEIISLQERSVLLCAYLGMSASEAAQALRRSTATVNAHRRSLSRKLGSALSPIVIARVIYAHKAIAEMCNLAPQIGLGKHYKLSDYKTHSDLLRSIVSR